MIIFHGNDKYAYRDPACFFHKGTYYLFFTVSEKENGYMYNRIGMSESVNLKNWSEPRILTEKNYNLNYCSPGNMIEHNGEFILCFSSYPMPFLYEECFMADKSARLFTMRTKDFKDFSKPEILNPKGDMPIEELGRMIDPFILKKEECYYLFFKQNGVSFSLSNDLKKWEFLGKTKGGENACVIKKDDEFILLHSPENGIGFLRSKDLENWEEMGNTTLRQSEWEWAKGRLTAGFAMETESSKYRYAVFFHGSTDAYPETHGNATLAVVFSNDLKNFVYELE